MTPITGIRAPARSKRRRGQAVAEFAVVLPVMLLLTLIAVDFGRLFFTYVGVTNAAREGAAFAIAGVSNPQCVTNADCANPGNITWHAQAELANDTTLQVTVSCAPYTNCRSSNSVPGTAGNKITVSSLKPFRLLTPIISAMFGNNINIRAASVAVIP